MPVSLNQYAKKLQQSNTLETLQHKAIKQYEKELAKNHIQVLYLPDLFDKYLWQSVHDDINWHLHNLNINYFNTNSTHNGNYLFAAHNLFKILVKQGSPYLLYFTPHSSDLQITYPPMTYMVPLVPHMLEDAIKTLYTHSDTVTSYPDNIYIINALISSNPNPDQTRIVMQEHKDIYLRHKKRLAPLIDLLFYIKQNMSQAVEEQVKNFSYKTFDIKSNILSYDDILASPFGCDIRAHTESFDGYLNAKAIEVDKNTYRPNDLVKYIKDTLEYESEHYTDSVSYLKLDNKITIAFKGPKKKLNNDLKNTGLCFSPTIQTNFLSYVVNKHMYAIYAYDEKTKKYFKIIALNAKDI